jgi:hypothetical protein
MNQETENKNRPEDEEGQPQGDAQPEEEHLNPEDPLAMYDEPPPRTAPAHSRWDAFRLWSHRHKRKIYLLFFVSLAIGIYLSLRSGGPGDLGGVLRDYFARFQGEREGWSYAIGEYFVGQDHLALVYPVIAKYRLGENGAAAAMQDPALYRRFIEEQYQVDALVYAAMRENAIHTPEARVILEDAVRRAVADYYVYSRIPGDSSDFRIEVTDAEVREFYERNKEIYEKSGDPDTALVAIRATLYNLKRDQLRQKLATYQQKVFEDVRNRYGPRIQGETQQ